MASTTSTAPTPEQVVRKHPIRGALWGLMLGLSISMFLVLFAVVPFADWPQLALGVIAGVAIGVLWAYFAPPKQPKGPPPAAEPGEPSEPADDDTAPVEAAALEDAAVDEEPEIPDPTPSSIESHHDAHGGPAGDPPDGDDD